MNAQAPQVPPHDVDALTAALHDLAWTMRHTAPVHANVPSVPTSDLAVLKDVLAMPGATVGSLSESLGLQRPNVSASLRSLESLGLIERTPDPGDRRRTLVHPTRRALVESQAIATAWRSVIAAAVAQLPSPDATTLLASASALSALNAMVRTTLAEPVD